MTKAASLKREIRFQQWVDQVAQFNARPDGMSMASWCRQQGIAASTFITRLHKVQDRCLDAMQLTVPAHSDNTALVQAGSPFVEVPACIPAESVPSAVFTCGNVRLEVSEDIPEDFLIKLIGALNHAK